MRMAVSSIPSFPAAGGLPKVTVTDLPEGRGRMANILLFKSLESCGLTYFAALEADVRRNWT